MIIWKSVVSRQLPPPSGPQARARCYWWILFSPARCFARRSAGRAGTQTPTGCRLLPNPAGRPGHTPGRHGQVWQCPLWYHWDQWLPVTHKWERVSRSEVYRSHSFTLVNLWLRFTVCFSFRLPAQQVPARVHVFSSTWTLPVLQAGLRDAFQMHLWNPLYPLHIRGHAVSHMWCSSFDFCYHLGGSTDLLTVLCRTVV